MEELEITTKSARETKRAGKMLAEEVLKTPKDPREALVIALEGDLGGGKTTFSQGFAEGLGIREGVLSPTFVIMRIYAIKGKGAAPYERFVHIDAYRLDKESEMRHLGWEELARDGGNIILVEWAGKIKKMLPKSAIRIQFEFVNDKTRNIVLKTPNSKSQ